MLEFVTSPVMVCECEMRWICQSINDGHDIVNAENPSEAFRTVIRQERVDSFMTVDSENLIHSKLSGKVEYLYGHRDTGDGARY